MRLGVGGSSKLTSSTLLKKKPGPKAKPKPTVPSAKVKAPKAATKSGAVSTRSREERKRKESPTSMSRDVVVTDDLPNPVTLVQSGGKVTSLTKRQNKKLRTMFGNNSDTILDLLETDDHDGAQTMIYRALLQTLVDIMPILEGNVRKSKGQRGAYQLNQTISQMRECIADIQAARDKSQFGARLAERHVQPAFLLLAQQYALSIMEIENSVDRYMTSKDAREFREQVTQPMKIGMSNYMRDQLNSVMQNIAQSLS